MRLANPEVRERVARVERLLEAIEALADAGARAVAVEAVQALLELYGEGLARVMEGADGPAPRERLAEDELIGHLLLLHGLHPVPVETRIAQALEDVRPYLATHGGDVEFLGITEGVARVRMKGSCQGCPSSAVTLRHTIEEAIQEAAPELLGVEAEEAAPAGFVPVSALL